VILAADVAFGCLRRAWSQERPSADDAFIAQHWRPVSAWTDEAGVTWLVMRCDAFDQGSRLCQTPDDRPPVCRGYPWYTDSPSADRAAEMPHHCSFLSELPPSQRPDGARPLIPITVISAREAL
jgi:hypothetical protein